MLKKGMAMCLIVTLFCMNSNLVFASEYFYTDLEKAIETGINSNANIRMIHSNVPAIEEGIRNAESSANRLGELYNAYKTYASMWEDPDGTWDHLKDLDVNELTDELVSLSKKIMRSTSPSSIETMSNEIEFINYAMMFGTDDPILTEKEVYAQYVKGVELIGLQANNELEKTLNNIELVKGNVTLGVTTIYMGILDLEVAIDTQEELIDLRKKILTELQVMLNEGLVSEFTVYSNEVELNKLEIEVDKLRVQLRSLKMTFLNTIGKDIDVQLGMMSFVGTAKDESGSTANAYADMAIENSPLLKGLRIDLNYYTQNYELYNKYEGYQFGAEYEELNDQIAKFTSLLRREEWNIRNNVKFAIADIVEKEQGVKINEMAYINAVKSLGQVKEQQSLGLVKSTDVHSAQLNVQSMKMNLEQSKRAEKNAEIKFDMLLDYGIEYQ